MPPAQGYISTYAPRLRQYANTLLQPVLQTPNVVQAGGRTTKRGTTIINYADDVYDDDDFDESEGPRRPTGLRSIRREDLEKREPQANKLGKEIYEPVDITPIYRDWMIRKTVKPTTDQQAHIQTQLPLTLIPIRIDVEVPAHQLETPFPIPQRAGIEMGMALTHQYYRRPEQSPPYKIRDIFLWNLHENLVTPEDFALNFVRELDLPNQITLARTIAMQISTQLEDYAGVALHPLFHSQPKPVPPVLTNGAAHAGSDLMGNGTSRDGTPRPSTPNRLRLGLSRGASITPSANTPLPSTPQPITLTNGATIAAHASPLPHIADSEEPIDPTLNPDDTYRCIITLSIYLSSRLYQDKFEWSLLHPPGAAEAFAKQTCADMGLSGEWVLAITHAIYEAVLRLKKEACDNGSLWIGSNSWGQGEIDNQAVRVEEGAGWRYDDQDFGAEWEPKFEALNKEEIEKREMDRERQLRRLRRETAKFSSTSGMVPTAREQEAQMRGSYFDMPGLGTSVGGDETPMMGRGERTRKKRRFRSPSPPAKESTPAGEAPGWGGESNRLNDAEKQIWRCRHCLLWGSAVWAVRDGPPGYGQRSLCNNCGLLYERDKRLPAWSKDLHKHSVPLGR